MHYMTHLKTLYMLSTLHFRFQFCMSQPDTLYSWCLAQ